MNKRAVAYWSLATITSVAGIWMISLPMRTEPDLALNTIANLRAGSLFLIGVLTVSVMEPFQGNILRNRLVTVLPRVLIWIAVVFVCSLSARVLLSGIPLNTQTYISRYYGHYVDDLGVVGVVLILLFFGRQPGRLSMRVLPLVFAIMGVLQNMKVLGFYIGDSVDY